MSKQSFQIRLLAVLACALIAATVWAAPQAASTTKKPASTTAHAATTTHAGNTAHPATAPRSSASLLRPGSLKLQAPAVFTAKFTTSKGDFVVEVTRAWSPLGADRFYNLVKYHFFDGAAFFRVLPGFVAQFGISPRPDVAQVWEEAKISDDPVTQSNARGTLTFATAGPNTRTTQLFINLNDNANLDSMGFSPFGKVVSGMDVVDKFYSGYGEGAPSGNGPEQGRIQHEGKTYLEQSFPLLDTIKIAAIVPPAPAAASKPAAAAPSKPATAAPGKPATTKK
jgi:peptidyl-prolyl cis-trans isomerase A (cyclophilin A)